MKCKKCPREATRVKLCEVCADKQRARDAARRAAFRGDKRCRVTGCRRKPEPERGRCAEHLLLISDASTFSADTRLRLFATRREEGRCLTCGIGAAGHGAQGLECASCSTLSDEEREHVRLPYRSRSVRAAETLIRCGHTLRGRWMCGALLFPWETSAHARTHR